MKAKEKREKKSLASGDRKKKKGKEKTTHVAQICAENLLAEDSRRSDTCECLRSRFLSRNHRQLSTAEFWPFLWTQEKGKGKRWEIPASHRMLPEVKKKKRKRKRKRKKHQCFVKKEMKEKKRKKK